MVDRSDPYFEIVNRSLEKVIFKSEVIRDDLNPNWDGEDSDSKNSWCDD